MRIATLSIGDELIYGEIVDDNAAHLAAQLISVGLMVQQHLTVGDNERDIVAALQNLSERSDAVIVSGGLGPTSDDLTARAAAKASGRHLMLNEEALLHLQRYPATRGHDLLQANEKQALLPAKARLIPNPVGTACGFNLSYNGCQWYFLPGVPAEMGRMLTDAVLPLLLAGVQHKKIFQTRVLKVFGLSEVQLDLLLKDLVEPGADLSIAYCVNYPEIQVKLRGAGANQLLVKEQLAGLGAKVLNKLQGCVFAEGTETMESVLARLFREKGVTLSLAESCTGGLLAKRLTDLAGSSDYFLEGAVTYSNAAKIQRLQVPARLIEEKGAVSPEVAIAMADGIRRLSGSDFALAVTGIAGPGGGSADKPVGTVHIALASQNGCTAKRYNFSGDRDRIRTVAAFMAMDWLRRHLLAL